MAILHEQPRRADVIAKTDVDLVALDRNDFLAALRGSEMLARLERLRRARDEGGRACGLLAQDSVLAHLTSAQKTQLQTYLVPCRGGDNEVLWRAGDIPRRAYLVADAAVALRCARCA